MDYHEYHKTRVPNAREILRCQMEPENIIHKVCSRFVKNGKVVVHLVNDKSRKFLKTVFFFLTAETMNSAGENNGNSKTMVRERVPSNEI